MSQLSDEASEACTHHYRQNLENGLRKHTDSGYLLFKVGVIHQIGPRLWRLIVISHSVTVSCCLSRPSGR